MAILASLAAVIVPKLAQHGLDVLQTVMRRGTDASIEKVNQLIQEKTGIDLTNVADDKLTPEEWANLRDFELQYQELLNEQLSTAGGHDIDRLKLVHEDRKDARAMNRDAMKSGDWFTRNFTSYYALLITLGTFGFFYIVLGTDLVFSGDIARLDAASQSKERIVDTVMGFLLGVSLSAIIQFYFGSSSGSSRKTDAMSNTIDTLLPKTNQGK